MKLYHGTSGRHLHSIIRNGLQPRGPGKKGNWKHTVESNPHCVYLTDAYPVYFALQATRGSYSAIIVEIDTNLLPNPLALLPDEDVLEQTGREYDDVKGDMLVRTRWYRKNIFRWANGETWKKSLGVMGTCCFYGKIPPEAITRIAIIPPEQCGKVGLWWDASISLMNYRILGGLYQLQTQRLFGDPVAPVQEELHREPNAIAQHSFWRDPRIPLTDIQVLRLDKGMVVDTVKFSLPDERDLSALKQLENVP